VEKNLSMVLVSREMKDLRKTAQRDLALETMEEIWGKKERFLSTMIII